MSTPSLTLQRALHRRQRTRIQEILEERSDAFAAYERRYLRRTRRHRAELPWDDVLDAVRRSDLVYVGDYHTLPAAQETYLELAEAARDDGRPLLLALELAEGRHQPALDAFLEGRIDSDELAEALGWDAEAPWAPWRGFSRVVEYARTHRLPAVAIDRRSGGPRSLELRDQYAAQRIARGLARSPDARVLTLVGQYHVAPPHLPARVRAELPSERARSSLTVYQNCEGPYWALAKEGRAGRARAVELSDEELCVFSASPVVCQQSFLDYLDGEAGDAPLSARDVSDRFITILRAVGRAVGLTPRRIARLVDETEVWGPGELDLDRLRLRGRFSRRELRELEAHVLSRESCYIPRARTVYLGSLSLNHLAEEASHLIRHACVGDAMVRERPRAEAFYARALEEAMGFLGSKLVNPARRPPSREDLMAAFREQLPGERESAAFTLAHLSAEAEGPEACAPLLPLDDDRLFHAVSHALGYRLGEALFARLPDIPAEKVEARGWLSRLFKDPLEDPTAAYFELVGQAATEEEGHRLPPRRSAASSAKAKATAVTQPDAAPTGANGRTARG